MSGPHLYRLQRRSSWDTSSYGQSGKYGNLRHRLCESSCHGVA
ncbi:hypothetical protein AK973_1524 [Pseudomonas brassicacearum]|nr:hypothetical protein AK973_1524 [Pseudomonas brassicacearum]